MLIAIAGAIGAGKSTVARSVSECMGLPVHSIDDDKRAVGAAHPDFQRWVAEATPFPDDFRRAVFDRTLAQLGALAGEHDHIIIEETFHKAAIREPFFAAAAEVMGGLILIEIAVSYDVAMRHLSKRASEEGDHLAGAAMFSAFQAIADPLTNSDLVVANNGELDVTVAEVCTFLETRLHSTVASPDHGSHG